MSTVVESTVREFLPLVDGRVVVECSVDALNAVSMELHASEVPNDRWRLRNAADLGVLDVRLLLLDDAEEWPL